MAQKRKLLLGEGQAETEVVASNAGREDADEVTAPAVAVRRAAVPRAVVPATAAAHTARPTVRPCRICLRVAAIIVIPILAPFPNITRHIVETQFIGTLGLHRMGPVAAVNMIPGHVVNVAATAVSGAAALVATACGKLPLGFCRQTEFAAGGGIQFADELLAVVPRNTLHGEIVTFEI